MPLEATDMMFAPAALSSLCTSNATGSSSTVKIDAFARSATP
jgi:hypothetical protein